MSLAAPSTFAGFPCTPPAALEALQHLSGMRGRQTLLRPRKHVLNAASTTAVRLRRALIVHAYVSSGRVGGQGTCALFLSFDSPVLLRFLERIFAPTLELPRPLLHNLGVLRIDDRVEVAFSPPVTGDIKTFSIDIARAPLESSLTPEKQEKQQADGESFEPTISRYSLVFAPLQPYLSISQAPDEDFPWYSPSLPISLSQQVHAAKHTARTPSLHAFNKQYFNPAQPAVPSAPFLKQSWASIAAAQPAQPQSQCL